MIKSLLSAKSALCNIEVDDLLMEVDNESRRILQHTILGIYKDLLAVCKKYNLTPYLIGGSCLGAIRHKGFIPWDDDLDVGMSRSDYQKFKKVFKKELSDRYVLNAPNYIGCAKGRFAKMMKKNTIFREIFDASASEECGIFVDIFTIDNVPDGVIARMVRGTFTNITEFIAGQVALVESKDKDVRFFYKRISKVDYYIRIFIGRIFSFRRSIKWYNDIDKMIDYKKRSKQCGILTGRKHYFGEIFDRDVFFPARYVGFCDIKAPVFNDTDTYLKKSYGDYMQIPPEDKREKHFIKELKF